VELGLNLAAEAVEKFFDDDPRLEFVCIENSLFGKDYYDLLFITRAPEDPQNYLAIRVPVNGDRLEEHDADEYVEEWLPRWRRIIYDAIEYDRKKHS
jgi:hypothetical protein